MPLPVQHKRLPRGLVRDEIHASLRDWIIQGVLSPGERVRDFDIAEQLGVSRTPVREALRRLEDEGLIETKANRWTRVSLVDVDAAEQIYPISSALECLALDLIELPVPGGTLSKLRKANERMLAALDRSNAAAASDANEAFHSDLVAAAENSQLTSIVGEMLLKIRRAEIVYFGAQPMVAPSVEEHEAVIDALDSEDVEAAKKALRDHWEASGRRAHLALRDLEDAAAADSPE